MANMSYCRYQNTLLDLHDCFVDMEERLERSEEGTIDGSYMVESDSGFSYEDDLSKEEKRAQQQLIALCGEIVEMIGD